MTELPRNTAFHYLTTMMRVTNIEQSEKWYTNLLGVPPVMRDSLYHIVNYETLCGAKLGLWELRPHEAFTPSSVNGAYVVLQTGDLDGVAENLSKRGISVGDPIVREGICVRWITDPDGNQLCLIQFCPE